MHFEAICFPSQWASNGHTKTCKGWNAVWDLLLLNPGMHFFQKKRGEKQGWKWRESPTVARRDGLFSKDGWQSHMGPQTSKHHQMKVGIKAKRPFSITIRSIGFFCQKGPNFLFIFWSARLFERALIWAQAYLSAGLFERTLIWAHAYLSARLFEQMPFTNTRANF